MENHKNFGKYKNSVTILEFLEILDCLESLEMLENKETSEKEKRLLRLTLTLTLTLNLTDLYKKRGAFSYSALKKGFRTFGLGKDKLYTWTGDSFRFSEL